MPRTRIKFSPFKHPPDQEKIDQMKRMQQETHDLQQNKVLLNSTQSLARPDSTVDVTRTQQAAVSPNILRDSFHLRDPIHLSTVKLTNHTDVSYIHNSRLAYDEYPSMDHSTSPLKSPGRAINTSQTHNLLNKTLDQLNSEEEEELEKSLVMSPVQISPERLQGSAIKDKALLSDLRAGSLSYTLNDKSTVTVSLNDTVDKRPLNKGKETPIRKRKAEEEVDDSELKEATGHGNTGDKNTSVLTIKKRKRENLHLIEDNSDIDFNDSNEDDFEDVATQHTRHKFKETVKNMGQTSADKSILEINRSVLITDTQTMVRSPENSNQHTAPPFTATHYSNGVRNESDPFVDSGKTPKLVSRESDEESEFVDSEDEEQGDLVASKDVYHESASESLNPVDRTNLSVIESTKIGASSPSERKAKSHLGFGLTDPPVLLNVEDEEDEDEESKEKEIVEIDDDVQKEDEDEYELDKSEPNREEDDNDHDDGSETDNFTNMAINGTSMFLSRKSDTPTIPLLNSKINHNILRAGRQTSMLNETFLNTSNMNFDKLGSSPVHAHWNRSISDVIGKQNNETGGESGDSDSEQEDNKSDNDPEPKLSSTHVSPEVTLTRHTPILNDTVTSARSSPVQGGQYTVNENRDEESQVGGKDVDLNSKEWSPEKWTKLKNDIELFLLTKDIRVFNKDHVRSKYNCDLNEIYRRCDILKKLFFSSSDDV